MRRVLVRVVVDAAIVAAVLFIAARTLVWPRAWILVGTLLVVRTVSAIAVFRTNPALLRERAAVLMHQHQPAIDRALLLAFMGTAFVVLPAVAALDARRWHFLPSPSLAVSILGLALFVLGWTIIGVALRANRFAVTVVRHQVEREHSVIDTGVYGVIRHPMYAGNPLVNVGLGLWLGSYAAALFAVIPLALLLLRVGIEERFLLRELPGYRDYTRRVRYRLLPGIW